jgi:acyl-coenzyme A synthetase/AMP-(fatty) acid ligase
MSAVRSRRNPITGSIVVADVVLKARANSTPVPTSELKEEILQICRDALEDHKVPAAIRFVADLDIGAAGKLTRHA